MIEYENHTTYVRVRIVFVFISKVCCVSCFGGRGRLATTRGPPRNKHDTQLYCLSYSAFIPETLLIVVIINAQRELISTTLLLVMCRCYEPLWSMTVFGSGV